jgi:hypothetical protein
MIRKFIPIALATVLMAGCAQEPAPQPVPETVEAVFRVGKGAVATKASSDGTKATQLVVGVYDREDGYRADLSIPVEKADPEAFHDLYTVYTAKLVKGHSYDFVFIAQVPDNPYYEINLPDGTLTVATSGLSNEENRDAFYAVYPVERIDGEIVANVVLHRPFAQINIVSDKVDFEQARASEISFERSSLRLRAPSVLHLVSGEADTPADYDFSANQIALHPDFQPYAEDYWIATAFVLSRNSSDLYNVEFSVYEKDSAKALHTTSVTGVPLKRNYRTTLFGSVLTAEGNFDIVINPLYAGSETQQASGQ